MASDPFQKFFGKILTKGEIMSIEYIKEWDDVIDAEWCEKCQHGTLVRDPCGTGDSPDGYECNANGEEDCPIMEQYEIDADQLTNAVLADVYKEEANRFESAYIESAKYMGEPLNDEKLTYVNDQKQEIIGALAFESLLD